MPDHHQRPLLDAGEPADHGAVVRKRTVAVELDEAGEHPFCIVEGVRPLRVAGDLGYLPGREARVYRRRLLPYLRFEATHRLDSFRTRRGRAEHFEPRLAFRDGTLELQHVETPRGDGHRYSNNTVSAPGICRSRDRSSPLGWIRHPGPKSMSARATGHR